MQVCFVTTSFVRSAEDHYARFVYEQAKSLLRNESETTSVVVVAPHAPGLARNERIDGLEIHRPRYFWPARLQRLAYQYEGLFETLRASPLAALQLPTLLVALMVGLWRASKRAHVVHAQWLPTAVIALPVAWLRRIPVVVSVRGADLNTARRSRLGRVLTRLVLRRAAYVVTVSDEFRHVLATEFGCSRPLAALYNGVDTVQFRPRSKTACRQSLELPPHQPIALYVGGLIERKGVDVLLHALAHDPVSSVAIDLYVAGEGPQLQTLKALTSVKGLTDRVHFLGGVSKDRIHLWMGAADVLVLPSYSEGRPNVVIEAMASGTPVVATAVNGTTELIVHGEHGLLFEPGDIAGLACCLGRILTEPGLAANLSSRGRQRIVELGLSWTTHGRHLLSIYHEALGSR